MFRSKNPHHHHLSNNRYENLKNILHLYLENVGSFSSEEWVNIYQNKSRHITQYDKIHIGVFPNLLRNKLIGMHSLLLMCVLETALQPTMFQTKVVRDVTLCLLADCRIFRKAN